MLKKLQHIIESTDINIDESYWLRFCEWAKAFHDVDNLERFSNFAEFNNNGEVKLPLKYFEEIEDLWGKWSKAVETDALLNARKN